MSREVLRSMSFIVVGVLIVFTLVQYTVSLPHALASIHECVDGIDNDSDAAVDVSDADCAGTWASGTPMPTARGAAAADVLQGEVYVVGGRSVEHPQNILATVQKYNPTTNQWSTAPSIQAARMGHVVASVGDALYVIGGLDNVQSAFDLKSSVEMYTTASNQWVSKAAMPTARFVPGSVVVDGKIYVIGGQSQSHALANNERYNPVTNSWDILPPMPTPRHSLAVTAVGDVIYAIGGRIENGAVVTTVEAYNTVTQTWSTAPSLPSPMSGMGAVSINGSMYVFGGFTGGVTDATKYTTKVYEYNVDTATWYERAPMSIARDNLAFAAANGVAFAIGGATNLGNNVTTFYATTESFVPSTSEGVPPNTAPELAPIGDQVVAEGATLSFAISATDDDGDQLTYAAANLPAGSSFDPETGVFTWNTDYNDAGNYPDIEFSVYDDGVPMMLDVELITITVGNVNRAPVFENPGPQVVLENEPLSFSVTASDPDGDQVLLGADTLPSGAQFATSTGVFTWTPSLADAGNYTITFVATDDGVPVESSTLEVVVSVGDNPTPSEQAEDLVAEVIAVPDLPQSSENAYLANLQKVEQFILDGKIQAALSQLAAFVQKLDQDYAHGVITNPTYSNLRSAALGLIGDLEVN